MKNFALNMLVIASLLVSASSLTVTTLACCPNTWVFDKDSLTCVCPSNATRINANNQCVACAAPSSWNQDTKICSKCKVYLNENSSGVCVCPDAQQPFDNGSSCTVCPQNNPLWNGIKCVACPANTHFIKATRTCNSCAQGFQYNQASESCEISKR